MLFSYRDKEIEDDEAVGRCDSSLANDDISDLVSSDSRLGFTSPDIALNIEGNLRPNRLSSPDQAQIVRTEELILRDTNSIEGSDSPRPDSNYFGVSQLVTYSKKGIDEDKIPSEKPKIQNSSIDLSRSMPLYEPNKKLRSGPMLSDGQKSPSPVFTKRERLSSRSNSASTSGSANSIQKSIKNSRSVSLDSADSACDSVIDNTVLEKDEAFSSRNLQSTGLNGISDGGEDRSFKENELVLQDAENINNNNQTERNLRFGSTTMFSSSDSLFESNSRHPVLSTPESVGTPEPLTPRPKILRSKFSYRACRNTTPDSLTTPEPSPTPDLQCSTSNKNHHREDRRAKRVTIDVCDIKRQEEKTSQDSGVSDRDFSTMVDYDLLAVNAAVGDGKDKVSEDSGVRSLLASADNKAISNDVQPVSKHDAILSWMGNSVQVRNV